MASFTTQFEIIIFNIFENFLKRLCRKYNLNEDELRVLLIESLREPPPPPPAPSSNVEPEEAAAGAATSSEEPPLVQETPAPVSKPPSKSGKMTSGKMTLSLKSSIKKYYHVESGLVFKSKDTRIIVGRLENDKVVKLTQADIDFCKKKKLEVYDGAVDEKGNVLDGPSAALVATADVEPTAAVVAEKKPKATKTPREKTPKKIVEADLDIEDILNEITVSL
jgi:hypothetical protein